MATVTEIAAALAAVINANLSDVDSVSIDDFTPAITTQSIACIVVPFSQRSQMVANDLAGASMLVTHWIPVEFWVRHVQGSSSTTSRKARDICTTAAQSLMTNDSTTYEIDTREPMESSVSGGPVDVGDVSFVVSTLIVPVLNEVTV